MRSQGSARELERRRQLAVTRVNAGYQQKDVAVFLEVHPVTVCGWVRAARLAGGLEGLQAKPTPGRPRKLTARQEKTALSWLSKSPTAFGFPGELWTSRRLAALIEQRLGVRFNANYLVEWLTQRDYSAQRPAKKARERDEPAIARWVREDWPRLQKKRVKKMLTLS